MGNLGSSIGALLSGAAEGFLQKQQEDKLQRQTEKAAKEKRIFDIAGLLFKDPSSRPEVKQLALGALTANKDALKELQESIGTGLIRIPEPGRTESALPQGQAVEVPAIGVNQEGKIDPDQPQVFQDDTAARPRPVELDLAPPETGPTPEALSREVIIEPSVRFKPLFRSPEELAAIQGNLDLIRKTAVLDDAEKRKAVTAEKKALRETAALNKAVQSVIGEGQDTDLVMNLILAGMTANEAFQQGGLDKKPTKVQRRTFTRAALDSAFFGLATIDEATADIPDSNLFSDTEIKGIRDEALLRRKNQQRIATGRDAVSFKDAGKAWNQALGRAQKRQVRDPNEVLPTFISLSGIKLEEQIDKELLSLGFNPDQIRQLVDRPFEAIEDLSGQLSGAERRAVGAGTAEALPAFRPVPSHAGVETPVGRTGKNPRDLAIELFKKDLE